MQSGLVVDAYKVLLSRTFKEFLLTARFTPSDIFPNIERFKQFLVRLKDDNPDLTDVNLCEKGLPPHWCYIQFTRSSLQYNMDADLRREKKLRTVPSQKKTFSELRFGYGYIDLQCFLVANDISTLEACETFFYRRLFQIRTIHCNYLDYHFQSECVHNQLENFSTLLDGDKHVGFTEQWVVRIEVPILLDDIEGFTVNENIIKVYDDSAQREVKEPGYRILFEDPPDKTQAILEEIVAIDKEGQLSMEIET